MLRRRFPASAWAAPVVAALRQEKIDEAEAIISKHVSSALLTTLPSNVSNKLLLKPASDLGFGGRLTRSGLRQ